MNKYVYITILYFADLMEVMDVCNLMVEIPSPASAILEVLSQL